MKIFVNLNQTQNSDGWTASIARSYASKGAKSEVAIGESEVYPSKETAWNSIKKEVQDLDYNKDEIYFNNKKVDGYDTLEGKVDVL